MFLFSFPVNAQLNDLDSLSDNFTVDQTYEIKYTSENFVLNSSIGSMKVINKKNKISLDKSA